jgi:integrase
MGRKLVQPGLYRVSRSRKFPKGSWLVRYRDPGNHIRQRSFPLKEDALDFQAEVRFDADGSDRKRKQKLARTLFKDVADRWYQSRDSMGRTPATLAAYRTVLKTHLLPAFGDRPISRIQPSDIEAIIAEAGVSPKTQRNILRVLSPIMKLAVRDGIIQVNPCPMVELRSNGEGHAEMRFLTAQQVDQLADEVGPDYSIHILFAACTGMRAGEIVALRVKHLDLMHRQVNVKESITILNRTVHIGTTKNKKHRQVVLPPFLAELLAEQVAGKSPEDYVFAGAQGGIFRHGNFYGRHFRPAVNRLVDRRVWKEELRGLRFHDLRHTCASLLISNGEQPLAVSRQLGHSSIAITMDRYSHLYPEDQDRLAETLEEVFQRVQAAQAAPVVPLRT